MSPGVVEDPREYGLPHESWRLAQRQAFEWAKEKYESGSQFLFCELPTGSGKSGIATALGSIDPVLIHVQTLNLLDQYRDQYGFTVVKGMANYNCVEPDKLIRWEERGLGQPLVSDCHYEPMTECMVYEACPYIVARTEAVEAQRSGCTYKFGVVSPTIQRRGGISVLDEAHAAAEECLDYATVTISEKRRGHWGLPAFPFRSYGSGGKGDLLRARDRARVMGWLEQCLKVMGDEYAALDRWDDQEIGKWKSTNGRLWQAYNHLMQGDWFMECGPSTCSERTLVRGEWTSRKVPGLRLRALSAAVVADRLWKNKDMVFLMSATIGDPKPLADELGISSFEFERFPHPVPVEARPVFDLGVDKMTWANLQRRPSLYQDQADKIWKFISSLDPSWRGLILTSSFHKILKLRDLLGRRLGTRLWNPPEGESGVLDFIQDPRQGLVAITTMQGWGHGIDLAGDLARFVVVAGIPFGVPTDNYYKVRQTYTGSSRYTWWQAYNTVPQAAGRVSRGEKDERGDWLVNVAALADGSCTTMPALRSYPMWFKEAFVHG